jgi:hypothetical protein
MSEAVDTLFEEFAVRWVRGGHPDVRDYLDRAGPERDELARLLDAYIAAAPVQPPSEETRAVFAALVPGEHETPPMLAMRLELGIRRSQIVRQLCSALGLGQEEEPKVARYYHELETGLLDPRGVSARVWHALATILSPSLRRRMLDKYEPPPVVVAAYYRRSDDLVLADAAVAPALMDRLEPAERDEVDMLFTGGA